MSGELDATPAEARVEDAAAERRRLRSSQLESSRQTSMREVLVGLAERAATVSVVVADGRSHRVRVDAVGTGVVVATTDGGRLLVLGDAAVTAVVTHGAGATAAWDHRGWKPDAATYGNTNGWHMDDILAQLVRERPRITAWIGTGPLTGTLVAVGQDVATMSLDGSGETAYVRLDSTTEISVSLSSSV